ncbi:type I-E CRISPR-associated protein Cas6/Cse3/CasE [Roseivivax sediminis]|uniref:CRISPR system Cascade subunit CasE n=1 Tax=Roseivivax sediminis TaxID=936889 RepID=A0A1I2EGS1_9RHOB|nr:type I-E CRISPR-associated protein Cas6/Cse3/CasE [Roseivivax sediminis]SFE91746.1 CRISPR system Cascade subunit CasE [Roseivivax sediminis]
MNLHLVEMPLTLSALHRWAGARRLGRGNLDEGLALHHFLGEVFGPGIVQPFRLMVAPRARRGTIYGYSAETADALRDIASAVAPPSESSVLELAALRSIARPPGTWQARMRLGFDLSVRPVVRLNAPIEGPEGRFAAGAEIDALLAETLRTGVARSREEVYLDWLTARLGDAADLDRTSTRLASFQRRRIVRGGRRLDGPDAVIHGTLSVRDPVRFADLLARGVGRHRSYGYGMLLLRPPQRLD